ncbi:MAG: virginiamycin B lyase family protein [Miltoncostaeaceae bacterium]
MFPRLARITAALVAAGACTSIAGAIPVSGQVTAYSPGSAADPAPMGMAAGPDGNMWFTQPSGAIARMTTAGDVTEFSAGLSAGSTPEGIAPGPDGNMWVALNADNAPSKAGIARVTMDGAITEFRTGVTAGSMPYSIAAGPDGNMWFTETGPGGNAIGRITPSGTVTEFQLPTPGENPRIITAGPDGNLWFTLYGSSEIGRITPAGVITEFALNCGTCTGITLGSPYGITTGVDGNLWFTMIGSNDLGLITPDGSQAYEDTGLTTGIGTTEIVSAPDGTMWFVAPTIDTILRVNVFGGYSTVATGATDWALYQMAAGPDGRMWIADNGGKKVRAITTGVGAPLSPYQFGTGLVGVQHDCGYAANTFGLPWTIGAVAYQWMLGGVPIAGATDSRFTPTSDQVGKTLACRVSPTYFPNLNQLGVTAAAVTIWAAAPAAAAAAAAPVLSLGIGAAARAHAGDIIRVSYVATATGTAKVTLRFRGSRTASTLWTGTVRKGSHAMRVTLPKRRIGVASLRLATTSPAVASVSRGITIVR